MNTIDKIYHGMEMEAPADLDLSCSVAVAIYHNRHEYEKIEQFLEDRIEQYGISKDVSMIEKRIIVPINSNIYNELFFHFNYYPEFSNNKWVFFAVNNVPQGLYKAFLKWGSEWR